MTRPKPPRGFDDAVPTILPRLTDLNPGSAVRALAEAMAKELAQLREQLEAIYDDAFVGTASSQDLDALAKILGVHRRRVDSMYAEAQGIVAAIGTGAAAKAAKKKAAAPRKRAAAKKPKKKTKKAKARGRSATRRGRDIT